MSNTPCAYAVCSVLHRRVEIKAESRHWGEQAYDNNQAGRCAEFVPNIVRIRLIDIALH